MPHITFVKKIKLDGIPCRKCVDVQQRLDRDGLSKYINQTVIADERDPASEGMRLATLHQVDRAPFFVVEYEDGRVGVYTIYLRFIKEVLRKDTSWGDEIEELMEANVEQYI